MKQGEINMSVNIFDKYDIRTRVCSLIFIISPFLLDGYIFIDTMRSLTFTVILLSVILAYCCFFICWIRYNGNSAQTKDYIAEFLSPSSSEIDDTSKMRYYRIISEADYSFNEMSSQDPSKVEMLLPSVSKWLRQNTRGEKFFLVKEEDINYGFIRNVYSAKKSFLWTFTVFTLFLLFAFVVPLFPLCSYHDIIAAITPKHILCVLIHCFTYAVWIFGVTSDMLIFVAKKYAKAVVEAIDSL